MEEEKGREREGGEFSSRPAAACGDGQKHETEQTGAAD